MIKRHEAVQKLTAVNPWAIHSNVMTAAPIKSGLQFFADVPWGRRLQINMRSKVMCWLLAGRLNEPGEAASPNSLSDLV